VSGTYERFDAPAMLSEFATDAVRQAWSDTIASFFKAGVGYNHGFHTDSQFYNPLETNTDDPREEPLIDWPAFPKLVKDGTPDAEAAWAKVDAGPQARLDYQDEYLEWHVVRTAGKITRVSFTCETTQYYEFLFKHDKHKLVEIYNDLVDPAHKGEVTIEDLQSHGKYNGLNKWNTDNGAIHLIQTNNNLYAEVIIAAQACIPRKRPDGKPITDSDELIRCARYGEPGRASDPKIGAIINEKARAGYSISLRNPVALYMTRWSSAGWKKPDKKTPVGNYWSLKRGKPGATPDDPSMGLHLVYEVPASEGFVVGDIMIAGHPIQWAGQIAENINVGLYGLLCRKGQSHDAAFECGVQSAPGAFKAAPTPPPYPLRASGASDK
jgi:hypothetical protein